MAKYIFMDIRNHKFFRTDLDEVVGSFTSRVSYVHASGDVDYQTADNERQDLIDAGWSEVPCPQMMVVKLYYMKESGKYYSTGELHLRRSEVTADPAKSWYNATETVRNMVDSGNLPGLIPGSQFDVFMSCEEHPNYVPTLVKIKTL